MFLIFRKCQPWIVLSMLLNFCQITGSNKLLQNCSYKEKSERAKLNHKNPEGLSKC